MARRPVLYPTIYPWYVVVATLDVLLTWIIVSGLGGRELNPIAAWVIGEDRWAMAALFKFATVGFVLFACEFVGRRDCTAGRRLAFYAVALNCIPVTASVAQLVAAAPTM